MNKKNQPVKDLVIDEDEAAVVREIYRLITVNGYGTNKVAGHLNEHGIKTKRGTTLWRGTSIRAIMGADRQRNWSELGKEGRLLILFVSQVIGCHIAHVRKTKLFKDYHSLQSILDEMRPIRYVEHPNTKPTITPFVGDQVKICEAFGFDIPDGCAPEYVVRKTNKGKRGRPRKNKLVVKEEN